MSLRSNSDRLTPYLGEHGEPMATEADDRAHRNLCDSVSFHLIPGPPYEWNKKEEGQDGGVRQSGGVIAG